MQTELIPRSHGTIADSAHDVAKNKSLWFVTLLLLLLCASADCPEALGQNTNSPIAKPQGKKLPAPPRDPRAYEAVPVANMNVVPNLPSYTGHMRLILGRCYPHHHRGEMYNFMVEMKEKPNEVASWYEKALKIKGWEVGVDQSTHLNLEGKLDTGDSVELTVAPSGNTDWPSTVQILYKRKRAQ